MGGVDGHCRLPSLAAGQGPRAAAAGQRPGRGQAGGSAAGRRRSPEAATEARPLERPYRMPLYRAEMSWWLLPYPAAEKPQRETQAVTRAAASATLPTLPSPCGARTKGGQERAAAWAAGGGATQLAARARALLPASRAAGGTQPSRHPAWPQLLQASRARRRSTQPRQPTHLVGRQLEQAGGGAQPRDGLHQLAGRRLVQHLVVDLAVSEGWRMRSRVLLTVGAGGGAGADGGGCWLHEARAQRPRPRPQLPAA